MVDIKIQRFQLESNRIEGIEGIRPGEVEALEEFLDWNQICGRSFERYVAVIQPDAMLRSSVLIPGVQVGGYVAPPSGMNILADLRSLLEDVNKKSISPHQAHLRYETLHPFTDGNGRSGRALWFWMHKGHAPLGFLHTWYYESLRAFHG